MPAFEYTALNEKGREKKGVLEGDSARQIRQQLRDKSWLPLTVEETKQKQQRRSISNAFTSTGISAGDLALITRQLATLIQAGLAVEECLGAVSKQTNKPKIKSMMLAVRSKVVEGHSFAQALTEYPRAFPDLYRATVASGEHSGHLGLVLDQLADFTERSHEVQQKVQMALLYPFILLFMSLLMIVAMLTWIVPKMTSVFDRSGQELPALTQFLIASSDFLIDYKWILLGGIASVIVLFIMAMDNEQFRFRFHSFLLRIPLVSSFIRGSDNARFSSTLSILTSSGVPLVEAVNVAGQVTSVLPIRKAINAAAVKISEGASLHRALEPCGYFPPMMIQMIASGENSGELDAMLDRSARNQERELESLISTVIGLFEPMILLFMGGMVLLMVLAIMLPIVSLNQVAI
ncbi:MAG: type II secretion system protein GspF [Gammaproteobacteria bacterium]|nr:MAG: type II secretion system protein GspF [Gammaproteobacteria bacterium]